MDIKIDNSAYRLAIAFSDENDIPVRFRKNADKIDKQKKINDDSILEKRFQEDVSHWKVLVTSMLNKIDNQLAWRFINISPKVDIGIKSVAYNKDFCDFIDYLVLRRDKENCDAEELGRLAMLSVAFQRKIEKQIETVE